MDFVYDPVVQADISEYVQYVTPVDGVQEVLTEKDPELGNNQLIFPDEEFTEDCVPQPDPPGSQEDIDEVTEAFQEVVTQ
jgi:spermidine/putrescine transport system substrate-binding protein